MDSQLVNSPDLPVVPGYELHSLIGQGGMGDVYRAHDLEMDRQVAVKILQERYQITSQTGQRFVEEAKITGQLQHPGIPAVYRVSKLFDGRPFLAMKLIKGDTLEELFKIGAELNPLAIIESIASALGYAHAHEVIHRDIKPANVMVGPFGEVQLMDWGLAKVLTRSNNSVAPNDPDATIAASVVRTQRESGSDFTQAGSVMGTPAYMPPEQAAGETDRIGKSSDVFGLGALACKLLTGEPPFTGADAEVVRRKAMRGQTSEALARLDACGAEPGLIALVKQCLALEPEDRPADGHAVAEAVAKLRIESEDRAKQAELARARAEVATQEQAKRRSVIILSAGALLTIVSIGAAVSWMQRNRALEAERSTAEQLRKTRVAEAAAYAKTKEVEKTLAIVEERTRQLGDAYGDFVFGIQDQLAHRPDTQALRRSLLTKARDGLAKILSESRGQGMADRTMIWNHFRMGDVEQQLGNVLAARKEYQTGFELAKQLAAANPDDIRPKRDLSISYNKLGDVTRRLGQIDASLGFYQKSLEISQSITETNPKNVQARRDLSMSYERLGIMSLHMGQTQKALGSFRKSLEIQLSLAQTDSKYADAHRDLSISYNRVGDTMRRLGQTKQALVNFQKGLEITQRLAEADPENVQAQRDLSISCDMYGDLSLQLGQTKDALGMFEKSFVIRKRLAEIDPKNVEGQGDLGISHNKLGDAMLRLGQTKEALKHVKQGQEIFQRLAAADPANVQAQRGLSISCDMYGDLSLQLGQTKEALGMFEKSLEICKRFTEVDPKNADAQYALGSSYNKLGTVMRQLGKTKEALVNFQKGLEIFQRLTEADPENVQAQRNLGISYFKLGEASLHTGQAKEALVIFHKRLAISQRLAKADPDNAEAQRDLYVSYQNMGATHQQMFEFDEAVTWYRRMIECVTNLPASNSLNLNLQIPENAIKVCENANQAMIDIEFVFKQPTDQIAYYLDLRLRALLERKKLEEVVITAERWEKWAESLKADRESQQYNAACVYAICATANVINRDKFVDRTIALLQRAKAKGFFHKDQIAHLKQDPDFAGISNHTKFKAFVAELEKQ